MNTTVATTQMACTWDRDENIAAAEALVRGAASAGAQIVLLPELFETPYFCQEQNERHFSLACEADDSELIRHFQAVASELHVVLPISFFERDGRSYYNSLAMIDADGSMAGIYRKSHIPDGPGYCEKFYFRPGDTGFKVFKTRFGAIGAAICWDQWFPEAARSMVLAGADMLLYASAIGSEPSATELDTTAAWMRVMQGHAVANRVPVVASNRVGTETAGESEVTFYGGAFIAGSDGAVIEQLDRDSPSMIAASFDLQRLEADRAGWGLFRDRRPDLYSLR